MFFEPTLLVYNSYLALIYGLFYLWFESFPLIFVEVSRVAVIQPADIRTAGSILISLVLHSLGSSSEQQSL